ncbi:unnamed protein product [Caenorhabditis angaria]|uniref:Seven TM Receptor n=1 Tax=Caenorhabditis angaria TaxID=860376 RepID=A0A9P1IZB6_9PELO|nr:unnamed protein product [Caenorhabditis angaria]
MSIPIFFGFLWGIVSFFLKGPDEEKNDAIRNTVTLAFGWNVDTVAYIGPYLYRPNNDGSSKNVHLPNTIGIVVLSLILTSSIVMIFVSAHKCYNQIKIYSDKVSRKTRSLQFQLFYALVTQTLIPLILMHLPVTMLFVFTIFDFDLGHASAIITVTIAIFPALDPFPVIFIIKHYRNAILRMIKKPLVIIVQALPDTNT